MASCPCVHVACVTLAWLKEKVVKYVTKGRPSKQGLSWGNLSGMEWHACLMGRVCAGSREML